MDTPQTLGSAALPLSHATPVDPAWEAAQQALIKPFVFFSHADLPAVKSGLQAEPRLANARLYLFDEAPIEAAAHMGRVEIAYYLLGSGAPLTVHAAVMLALKDTIEAYFTRDASLALLAGAHGTTMMFHAAMSGDIEVCELVVASGGPRDFGEALHAAVSENNPAMVHWLLAQGAVLDALDYQKRTPLEAAEDFGYTAVAAALKAAAIKQ